MVDSTSFDESSLRAKVPTPIQIPSIHNKDSVVGESSNVNSKFDLSKAEAAAAAEEDALQK